MTGRNLTRKKGAKSTCICVQGLTCKGRKKGEILKLNRNAPRVTELLLEDINSSKNSEWRTVIVISTKTLTHFL